MFQPLHLNKITAMVVCAALLAGCAGGPGSKGAMAVAGVQPKQAGKETTDDPKVSLAYKQAQTALNMKKYDQAIQIFTAITKIRPESAQAYTSLGLAHRRAEQVDEAEAAYRQAIELNKEYPEPYNQLGILYRENGRFTDALSIYEQGLTVFPANANLNLNLGILYDLYFKQPDKALEHYQAYEKYSEAPAVPIGLWISDLKQRLER